MRRLALSSFQRPSAAARRLSSPAGQSELCDRPTQPSSL